MSKEDVKQVHKLAEKLLKQLNGINYNVSIATVKKLESLIDQNSKVSISAKECTNFNQFSDV